MADEEKTPIIPTETEKQLQKQTSKTERYAPDGGWGWVVVFASFMLQALTIGVTYTFGIIFVDLLAYFNTTESTAAWIGSIQPALLYFTGIIAAPLLKRVGWRAVSLSGSVISAIGFVTSALAPNIYVLYLTYGVLTGIGNGCMYVTSMVCVQHYFKKRRAMATGIAVSGSGVGTLIFGVLSQYLLDTVGWRYTVAIDGAIVLVVGLSCGALFRPLPDVPPEEESDREPLVNSYEESGKFDGTTSIDYGSISCEHTTNQSVGSLSYEQSQLSTEETIKQQGNKKLKLDTNTASKSIKRDPQVSPILEGSERSKSGKFTKFPEPIDASSRKYCRGFECISVLREIFDVSLFKNPVFSLYAFAVMMFAFGYHVPYTYTPERAILLGISSSKASFLISIMGISNVGFRLLLGWIADKSANIRFYFAGIALMMMGALGLMVSLFNTYTLLVVYSVLFGAFSGSFAALFPVILVDILGLHIIEKSMGQLLAVSSIAFLIASPMSGFIIDKTSNINIPFMVVGGFGIAGGVIYFLIRCFLPRYGYQGEDRKIETPKERAIRQRRQTRFISESFA